jgi:hypothetical protein
MTKKNLVPQFTMAEMEAQIKELAPGIMEGLTTVEIAAKIDSGVSYARAMMTKLLRDDRARRVTLMRADIDGIVKRTKGWQLIPEEEGGDTDGSGDID